MGGVGRRPRAARMSAIVPSFDGVPDVVSRLRQTGYLADDATATSAFLADRLGKPLLVEGPAGVGKTELARALATATGAELIRLQCYEGIDEARALYEWNHAKQILAIQATGTRSWDEAKSDIFSDEFLLPRPLLRAISRDEPTVLLIDEVDKADVDMEGLLLEVLSDFAVTIPEMGTVAATRRPIVLLTSNATRELSEALKRRCLYLYIDFPDAHREREILSSRVPELGDALSAEIVRIIGVLRTLDIRKKPSVAETIDWANTLLALGAGDDVSGRRAKLDDGLIARTLGVVLKHRPDLKTAIKELKLG
ncbi:MoxR family ATPase [Gordonia sp. (in: high G+C Gram-positive bacteria)]|uniref:AAA family ATPase n=2 Tax=Gordonia sp. (in: high G+C Gram-positive bacteria) TaxID=84139 RepID=UPI001DBAC4F8|nr:MoxR family ATPase [Gordonia sp. (in: high G+C Gram-positive bacteria)]MCB1293153.1 MoxR family ATPase [Gordonia sp. (in: high G+C Gram-positive bacteria)]HMS75049.1 MoxR family ATPase [Gordonia sp. (in: high G+C Gram-positive bacteria)]